MADRNLQGLFRKNIAENTLEYQKHESSTVRVSQF
jgi:hypothetical protein